MQMEIIHSDFCLNIHAESEIHYLPWTQGCYQYE